MVAKLEMWGGGRIQDVGINIYIIQYIKCINNKNLLHSTRNSTQYSVVTYMEKQWEGIPWGIQWFRLGASTVGLIPAQGTKILQATQGGQKKKRNNLKQNRCMYMYN